MTYSREKQEKNFQIHTKSTQIDDEQNAIDEDWLNHDKIKICFGLKDFKLSRKTVQLVLDQSWILKFI